VDKATSSDR